MRRVVIIGSASGNGKTTLGRALAQRLAVPFVELDALVHGPNWTETPDDELRAALRPIVAEDGWVIDGDYQRKLGTLVLDRADTIVWLDLPTRVWVPRLARRSMRRISGREPLWNGNRETLKTTVWGRGAGRRPPIGRRRCLTRAACCTPAAAGRPGPAVPSQARGCATFQRRRPVSAGAERWAARVPS